MVMMVPTDFETDISFCRESNLQYIPAKIETNLKANVDANFTNLIAKEEDGTLRVEFRGRPLNGDKIEIPEDFRGFIALKTTPPQSFSTSEPKNDNQIEKRLMIVSDFTNFTYWNWDKRPSGMDAQVKLLDWLNVSQVLHAPSTSE